MRVLHYFLGFPPFRTGGMTKFAYDLMISQINNGDKVSALWPGRLLLNKSSVIIRKRRDCHNIKSYEIINPLPVSYDEGIKNIDAFTKKCDKSVYIDFLQSIKPDVIHIHTFMGLHKEFILAAKELGIKSVFTTHDFFPFCPKVMLYKDEDLCNGDVINCPNCNNTALSINKLFLLQLPLYRIIKDSYIVKKVRKLHRNAFINKKQETTNNVSSKEYSLLREYYISMLQGIDIIHFNSFLAETIYKRFMNINKSVVISISHGDIVNHKKIRNYNDNISFSYLGPARAEKGYFLLKEVLDDIWAKNNNFILNIYCEPPEISPYMVKHKPYTYNDFENVFSSTDMLIVPSTWYETFGYTVLEALSYGVPVIISNTVGARDILNNNSGIVFISNNKDSLKQAIEKVDKDLLKKMNRDIVENQNILSIEDMYREIKLKCYGY